MSKIDLSLEDKDSGLTWDEATMTWDEATGTWDNPKRPMTLETKSKVDLSLGETKSKISLTLGEIK